MDDRAGDGGADDDRWVMTRNVPESHVVHDAALLLENVPPTHVLQLAEPAAE